jgi:hypothetical protein
MRTLLSASALSAPAIGGLGGLNTNESRKRLRANTTSSYTGVNINPENDVGVAYTYAKIVSVEVRCRSMLSVNTEKKLHHFVSHSCALLVKANTR